MWLFFQNEVTRGLIEMVFGSTILKMYPKIVRDFWEFDDSVDVVESAMLRIPRFMSSKGDSAQDRLLANMKEWLRVTQTGENIVKHNQVDDDMYDETWGGWDADKGSKFFQARDGVLANIPTLDHQARAAEALSILREYVYLIALIERHY